MKRLRMAGLLLTVGATAVLAAPRVGEIIEVLSGADQVVAAGEVFPLPVVVRVTDAGSVPLPGERVTAVVDPGAVFLVPDHVAGTIETAAGTGNRAQILEGGPALAVDLWDPLDVALDESGNLFIADLVDGTEQSARIWRLSGASGELMRFAGGGPDHFSPGIAPRDLGFIRPRSVEVGKGSGDLLFVATAFFRQQSGEYIEDRVVFRVAKESCDDPTVGGVTLVAGGGDATEDGIPATDALLPAPVDASEDYQGNLYVASDAHTIRKVEASTGLISTVMTFPSLSIRALEVHRDGKTLSVATSEGYLIVDPVSQAITTFNTTSTSGTTVDVMGTKLFSLQPQVRMLQDEETAPAAGLIVAGTATAGFSGDGGPATAAQLDNPSGLAVSEEGDVWVADRANARIRKISFPDKETECVSLYTDRFGIARTPRIKSNTNAPLRLRIQFALTSGASAEAACMALGGAPAPSNPYAQPDPNHTPRRVDTEIYPRWTPLVSVEEASDAPPPDPPPPEEGGGSSHKTIAVDSKNVVHVVSFRFVSEGLVMFYYNNRWETRRNNGFSESFPVGGGVGGDTNPSIAVDSDDDSVTIVWERGGQLFMRRLSQNPLSPGWSPIVPLTAGGSIPTLVVLHRDPHLASDPVGGIHLTCIRQTTDFSGPFSTVRTDVLYAKDNLSAFAVIDTRLFAVGGDTMLSHALVEAGPDGLGQFTYAEAANLFSPHIRHYKKVGATGVSMGTGPLNEVIVDLAVDGSNEPHFIRAQEIPTGLVAIYRRGSGGADEAIGEGRDDIHVPVGQRPRLLVDVLADGTPHITWPVAGTGVAYATRSPGASVGTPFEKQDPIDEARPAGFMGPFGFDRVSGHPISQALSRSGTLHLLTSGEPFYPIDRSYTRTFEPNLGGQDGALMESAGPGLAIDLGNGNVTGGLSLFSSRGVGFSTSFSLVYNSQEPDRATISPGWMHNYHVTLTEAVGSYVLTLQLGDGRTVVFEYSNSLDAYVADPEYGYFSRIDYDYDPEGFLIYTMTTKSGVKYFFARDGKLAQLRDLNGNTMVLTHGENGNSNLAELSVSQPERVLTFITDSAGRRTQIHHGSSGEITQVDDPGGEFYQLIYEDATGALREVRLAEGVTWKMAHGTQNAGLERNGLLKTLTTPRGNPWSLEYYHDNRAARAKDPRNAARVVTYRDPEPGAETGMTFVVDRRGFTTMVEHEPRRNLAREILDPLGKRTTREFQGEPHSPDGFRNLTHFTDKGSLKAGGESRNTTVYAYVPSSDITTGDGVVHDNLQSITRPGAPPIVYEHTPVLSRVASVTDSRGATTFYGHDAAMNPTSITHAPTDNKRATFSGGTVALTPANGSAVESFTYTGRGQADTHTNANGGVTRFGYAGPTGLVTSITRPDHALPEILGYDVMGNTTSHQMPEGGLTRYVLDHLYRPVDTIEPSGDTADPTTHTEYDLDSNPVLIRDPRGFETINTFDDLGRNDTTQNALGHTMSRVFDAEGNTLRTTGFGGEVSTATYDALGRPKGSTRSGPPTTTSESQYDGNGNMTVSLQIGAHGSRATRRLYDGRNNGVSTMHPADGLTDETALDANDNPIFSIRRRNGVFVHGTRSVLDARNRTSATVELTADPGAAPTESSSVTGHTTMVFHDRDNNRTHVVDPDGKTMTMAHDLAGRQVATADHQLRTISAVSYNDNDLRTDSFVPPPAGIVGGGPGGMLRTNTSVYNARNELKQSIDALGNVTTNTFDAGGNTTATQDPAGGLTTMEHDALSRRTHLHQHVNSGSLGILTTITGYDAAGNTASIVDPRGNVYVFGHDLANRMIRMETPLGFVETWSYTDHGEVAVHVDANGKVAENEYDDLGRLEHETHTRGGIPTAEIHRCYDGASNLTEVVDTISGIRISNGYTVKNELESSAWFLNATGPASGDPFRSVSYTYRPNGPRATLSGPDGELFEYGYDDQNRPTEIRRDGVLFARMEYDVAGRRTFLRYFQGGTAVSVTETLYTAREEILGVITRKPDSTPIAGYSYTYTAVGNRETMTILHENAVVTYSNLPVVHWLSGESWAGGPGHSGAYLYDGAGNRKEAVRDGLTASYTVDADNRLTRETRQVRIGSGPPSRIEIAGTPVVDSTKPGRSASVIVDGAVPDSPSAPNAWMNQDTGPGTGGSHFAGLTFPAAIVDEIVLWIPTMSSGAGTPSSAGIARFKFQALIGGTWVDAAPTGVLGASPSAPGWLGTPTPPQHEIVATFPSLICEGIRVLMDGGGGSVAHPNRLLVNEIEAYMTTTGQTIEGRLIEYGHDAQGNMVGRTVHAGPAASDPVDTDETFIVDYMNRIAGYLRQDGMAAVQAHHAYAFTPNGQRICSSNIAAGTSEWYMSDGDDVLADYSTTSGGTTFTRTAGYVNGLGIDSKVAKIASGGSATYYVPDGLGSVGVIVDAAGTVTDARLTNAWGEELRAPQTSDRYGYTQREAMPEIAILGGTPAMHYRARTYFPELGRFGQRDPVDFIHDHYLYASNKPILNVDPLGLQDADDDRNPSFLSQCWKAMTWGGVKSDIDRYGGRAFNEGVLRPTTTAFEIATPFKIASAANKLRYAWAVRSVGTGVALAAEETSYRYVAEGKTPTLEGFATESAIYSGVGLLGEGFFFAGGKVYSFFVRRAAAAGGEAAVTLNTGLARAPAASGPIDIPSVSSAEIWMREVTAEEMAVLRQSGLIAYGGVQQSPGFVMRVYRPGEQAFRLMYSGQTGVSVFNPILVSPALTAEEVLCSFSAGSKVTSRTIASVEELGLIISPSRGASKLPLRLQEAHSDVLPGTGMSYEAFKDALKKLSKQE